MSSNMSNGMQLVLSEMTKDMGGDLKVVVGLEMMLWRG